MEPVEKCRALALACSEAVVYDASIPRPGLSYTVRPKPNPDPSSIIAASPRAYELCLQSCLSSYNGDATAWVRLWSSAVEELAARGWGNPSMGSLLLLSLHAASLGWSLSRRGCDSVEAVMGSSRELIEYTGVNGAVEFYRALTIVKPSYLGRLSWAGLPDASSPTSLQEVVDKRVTLWELLSKASIYDPVARDAARGFELSLGLALGELEESSCRLGEAVEKATLLLIALEGDLLLRRKLGFEPRRLALEAYHGSETARAELWAVLKGSGPGSVADVVVNALARLLYEAETGRVRVGFTGC